MDYNRRNHYNRNGNFSRGRPRPHDDRFRPYDARSSGNDYRQTDLVRKINDFIDSVKRSHPLGELVLCLKCDEHPYVSLQNSLSPMNIPLNFLRDPKTSEFILRVGSEELARGDFPSQKEAKIGLAWFAIDKLHKCCFAIIRKEFYQEVKDDKLRTQSAQEQEKSEESQTSKTSQTRESSTNLNTSSSEIIGQGKETTSPSSEIVGQAKETTPSSSEIVSQGTETTSSSSEILSQGLETTSSSSKTVTQGKEIIQDSLAVQSSMLVGSKAYNMMLKMGWRGSGLGAEEQGMTQNILVNENIDRRGLGHEDKGDITTELRNLLTSYSRSNKLTTLAFSKDFTKEERELIHKFCQSKLRNLKTRSVGRGEDRYLTVTRKITKMEIVAELIKIGCENESYKLVIPDNFKDSYENLFGNSRAQ